MMGSEGIFRARGGGICLEKNSWRDASVPMRNPGGSAQGRPETTQRPPSGVQLLSQPRFLYTEVVGCFPIMNDSKQKNIPPLDDQDNAQILLSLSLYGSLLTLSLSSLSFLLLVTLYMWV